MKTHGGMEDLDALFFLQYLNSEVIFFKDPYIYAVNFHVLRQNLAKGFRQLSKKLRSILLWRQSTGPLRELVIAMINVHSSKWKKKGHETATASSAIEIIKVTGRLAFLPEIVAQDAVAKGDVEPVIISSQPVVRRTVYLSVKNGSVKKKNFELIHEAARNTLK